MVVKTLCGRIFFAVLNLLFFGQIYNVQAFRRAGVLMHLRAFVTLDEKEVTGLVGAVGMACAWLATLVAFANYFFGNAFAKALIKHKIYSVKFGWQPCSFDLAIVIDDAAM